MNPHNIFLDYDPNDLEATVHELVFACANESDALISSQVSALLHDLRESLGMEVLFVASIHDGQRTFVHVDTDPDAELVQEGVTDALNDSYCKYVLEGTLPPMVSDVANTPAAAKLPPLPFRVGAFLTSPIVLSDGRVYGTLCSFSRHAKQDMNEKDLQRLSCVARVIAQRIDAQEAKGQARAQAR